MSENRMNNITMAVNLNLSQALDMTYIYGRVSAMCMMFDFIIWGAMTSGEGLFLIL